LEAVIDARRGFVICVTGNDKPGACLRHSSVVAIESDFDLGWYRY
jgi:hypothetical protein